MQTEKAYILGEAMIYMKQLQERVKELENDQNKRRTSDSRIFIKKSQICPKEEAMPPPLPQVEAMVLEKEVLIGIHCHKQKDIVLKIMALLQNLHLSLASSSVLPFGTSTLKVTVIAQMGDKYSMTVNDLVKSLRQDLLTKSHDIQESRS
ncbi:transcription factor NAI1 [Cajanus cajan]|uniref:transcription factor NAI1 n=1 Tax=Cajanus cajan TaxID=3821 RepID=UPI00098D9E6E|nr:transcription factor NAI1 [Cajanus cajan]